MRIRGHRIAVLAVIGGLAVQANAAALPAPSKTGRHQSAASLQADLEAIHSVLERQDVVAAIERHGFAVSEVHSRLSQLSPQEVHQFASQMEYLQAAGLEPPNYIWILLGVFLGVLILATIF